jgi:DNA-binding LacI/PurR family transcriptional regulator
VFFNSDPASKLIGNICIEYEHGVHKAIQHVVDLGHSSSAVIAGPADNRTAVMIKKALVSGLTARGLKPVCVLESNYRVDAGASAVREVLSRPEIPTVMFCGNDLIAMGAMSALEEAGVRVPEDVSVIGIDDIFFAYLARPPLTTISVPREQLGVQAFEALNRILNLKRRQGANYTLETDLVVRKSTAAARRYKLKLGS